MSVNEELQAAKERLQLYRDAEKNILLAQSYSIAGRSLARANLSEVQEKIKELESEVKSLETRGTKRRPVYRVCPLDD